MIYGKTNVQPKAKTDSIGRQQRSHEMFPSNDLTEYNTKIVQINLVEK